MRYYNHSQGKQQNEDKKMKIPSPSKIQELTDKYAALNAAQNMLSAVISSHTAMTYAGMGGCASLVEEAQNVLKAAKKQFKSAYDDEAKCLDDDSADILHKIIFD